MKLMLFGEGSYYFMCVMGMLFTVGMAALVGVKIYMENKLSYFHISLADSDYCECNVIICSC